MHQGYEIRTVTLSTFPTENSCWTGSVSWAAAKGACVYALNRWKWGSSVLLSRYKKQLLTDSGVPHSPRHLAENKVPFRVEVPQASPDGVLQ